MSSIHLIKFWTDEEKAELKRICEYGWDYEFPGYSWVALMINDKFNNNRTASACRNMDQRQNSKPRTQ